MNGSVKEDMESFALCVKIGSLWLSARFLFCCCFGVWFICVALDVEAKGYRSSIVVTCDLDVRQQEIGTVILSDMFRKQWSIFVKPCSADMSDYPFDVPTVETVMIYGDDAILVKVEDWLFGWGWSPKNFVHSLPPKKLGVSCSSFYLWIFLSHTVVLDNTEFQCYRIYWAMPPPSSSSKAKSRPLPRATFEDAPSDDSSSQDERRAMPKMRPLLGPFSMILGGQLIMQRPNKRRRTEPTLIERLPLTLQGAIKFRRRPGGPMVRPITLTSPAPSRGQWRRVYFSDSYPKLAFKLRVRDDYYDQEVRVFRDIPFYTTQYVQSFNTWIDLGDWDGARWQYQRCQLMMLVCEKITPMSEVELSELDGGKLVFADAGGIGKCRIIWVATNRLRLIELGAGIASWWDATLDSRCQCLAVCRCQCSTAVSSQKVHFGILWHYWCMDALLPDSQKHFKQIPHNNMLKPADIIAEIHSLLQQHYPPPLVRWSSTAPYGSSPMRCWWLSERPAFVASEPVQCGFDSIRCRFFPIWTSDASCMIFRVFGPSITWTFESMFCDVLYHILLLFHPIWRWVEVWQLHPTDDSWTWCWRRTGRELSGVHRTWMEGELMNCPWKKNNNESCEAVAVKPFLF